MKLSIPTFLLALVFCNFSIRPATAEDGLSFSEQCPKLLAIADDFAHECLQKARSPEYEKDSGTDESEQQSSYAYFRAVDTGSHFGLGCSLDSQHRIAFLGVYYSLKSSNFAIANTLPILRALSGDGAILLKKDNQNNFINFDFIRPFRTAFINATEDGGGGSNRLKNCESAELPKGWFKVRQSFSGDMAVFATPAEQGIVRIKKSYDSNYLSDSVPSEEYEKLSPGDDSRIIYSAVDHFVTDNGGLLIPTYHSKLGCPPPDAPYYVQSLHSDFCVLIKDKLPSIKERETGQPTTYPYILPLVIVLFLLILKRSPVNRKQWYNIAFSLPVIGPLILWGLAAQSPLFDNIISYAFVAYSYMAGVQYLCFAGCVIYWARKKTADQFRSSFWKLPLLFFAFDICFWVVLLTLSKALGTHGNSLFYLFPSSIPNPFTILIGYLHLCLAYILTALFKKTGLVKD